MELLSDLDQWRDYALAQRAGGRRIGLVPTMGALHQGHVSLVRAAQARGDVVLVTMFVNPRQFNDPADLRAYPRTPEADRALASTHGVDCLVEPSIASMWPDYPRPTATVVSVHGLGDTLEGATRPGHFDGVASVVAKLFSVTGPCRAYFGEKDFQQLVVVRQLVRDLAMDVEVIGCPIARSDDGLAYSSRNVRLSAEGRRRALAFSRALGTVRHSPARASVQRQRLRETLDAAGVDVAYAEVVDPLTLTPATDGEVGARRAMLAGVVEGVRLIDNGPVNLVARRGECC